MEKEITPKIYLVEDDVFYNRTLQHALRHSEFSNVKAFTNGEDFIRELKFDLPDMVILDYNLGDTNGLELLDKVKAFSSGVKVVMLSAQEKTEIALESVRRGALTFIKKDKLAFSKLKVLARKIKLEKNKIHFSPEALAM